MHDCSKEPHINLILAIIYQGFHDYAKMKCGKKVHCCESDPDDIIKNISVYNPELIQNIKKKCDSILKEAKYDWRTYKKITCIDKKEDEYD